ncbi:hypothetical protein AVEN_55322-1 [Araneus ventricosus]|uniref:Uncharacterized protein n=1 Tax=Araneus ventricosus TaxID=182803 RepID=A0A4Y2DC13_ARAVE|nr:hypothetical protein AVEN_55322-1 [Araneus ventricosus]
MKYLLSVRDDISSRHVVWMVAVAIETGYRSENRRTSFKSVRLAHLEPHGKERATTAKQRRQKINDSFPAANWRQEKKEIKPRLPSDFPYSKWIFPYISSCYSDRYQPDNLAGSDLVVDRQ